MDLSNCEPRHETALVVKFLHKRVHSSTDFINIFCFDPQPPWFKRLFSRSLHSCADVRQLDLKGVVDDLISQISKFNPKPVHTRFVVIEVALGSALSLISPVFPRL